MRILTRLRRRLRLLLSRDAVEAEQARELQSHLDHAAREHERAGLSPSEARRRAVLEFGPVALTAEAARDARGGRAADELARDLRYAVRQLRRSPGHTIATIGILATAIAGVGLAIALHRSYVRRPLPLPEPDRLVSLVAGLGPGQEITARRISQIDWTPVDSLFEATAAWDLDGFTLVQPGVPAEYIDGAWVSPGYFTLLGLTPMLGRGFAPDEYVPGSNVALISDRLWRSRFGGNPSVIGRTVRMHSTDRPAEDAIVSVVGVLPPTEWHLNRFTDIIRPLGTPRAMSLARLPVGMSREDGAARLTAIVRSQVQIPDSTWAMRLPSTQAEYAAAIRPALDMLAAAALLLLLLAEASVGALLVARATARLPELALRRVLGASRGRLMRQIGAEAVLASMLALVLGVAAAAALGPAAGRAVEAFGGVAVPGGSAAVRLDGVGLGVVALLVVVPYLALAIVPALGPARAPSRDNQGSARLAGGRRLARTRQVLVTLQVAVAVALLVPGMLLVRSARQMQQTDLGFAAGELLKAHVLLPRAGYADGPARRAVVDRLLARVKRVPGAVAAAGVMPHPFRGNPFAPVECEHCAVRDAATFASPQTVTTGYFRTMGIELVRGRVFDDRDDPTSMLVAIVSRSFATSLWGTDNVLGRRVRPVTADRAAPWLTVVGVVADVRKTYSDSLFPDFYRPFAQDPRAYFALMVRATGPLGVERGVRDAMSAEDPTLALADVEPMAVVVAARRGQTGMLAAFVGGVATVALGLTIAGLYAVVSYLVRTRRRELAVRLALGAGTSRIVGTVLREARAMIVAGLGLGVALALAGGRLSRAWLMELSPHDPLTLAGVVAAVLVVACLALTVPARQAAATDPANVLREE